MDMIARGLAKKAKEAQINSDKFNSTNTPQTGQIPSFNPDGTVTWVDNGGSGADTKDIKISPSDNSSSFLVDKVQGTTGAVTVTKTSVGGNEKLVIGLSSSFVNQVNETGNYTVTYTNDADNKRPTQETVTGDITRTSTYEYIAGGQANAGKPYREIITENGKIVTKVYAYDGNGLLSTVTVTTTNA